MTHTPGPWTASAGGVVRGGEFVQFARGKGQRQVAMVCVDDHGEERQNANAQLIAAAPELYEELTDFHDHAIDQGWHECEGIPGGCPVVAVLAKAQVAR